jgi:protein-disulfide isomerase
LGKRSPRVAAAKRSGPSVPVIAAVVVVVLLAVVVIGGVLLSGRSGSTTNAAPIPTATAPAQYPTTVEGNVIVAGNRAANVLDVYEDALCPACKQFEEQAATPIAQAVAAGRLQVRYHMVNLLDRQSRPAGYSTLGGNAMMCAAENNAFPTVHTSLYKAQPEEGGTGYTAEQLVDLGQRAGAGPGYADCVTSGRHSAAIADNFQRAVSDPKLSSQGGFGTPTLVLDGKLQTSSNSGELERILAG